MNQANARNWVTPTLVSKPISETLAGPGADTDGRGGEEITS